MCGGFSSRCEARATLSAPTDDKNVADDSFGGDIDAQNTTETALVMMIITMLVIDMGDSLQQFQQQFLSNQIN